MVKLLSIVSIIFAIVLFPPAALAVISNNAVPGDVTYPIKRSLEDGIYAVASLNPVSKAWFSKARSDRRFKEFSTLIAQGKSASITLVELVSQTDVAAEEIKKIDDPVKKEQLIAQLSQSIEKYDQGLKQITQQTPEIPHPTVTPSPQITTTPAPVSSTKPLETSKPTPEPSPTLAPSPSPIHTPEGSGDQQQEVNDAIDKLKKIKDKLKQEEKSDLTPKKVPTPEPDAKSTPAGRSVKTKNEK